LPRLTESGSGSCSMGSGGGLPEVVATSVGGSKVAAGAAVGAGVTAAGLAGEAEEERQWGRRLERERAFLAAWTTMRLSSAVFIRSRAWKRASLDSAEPSMHTSHLRPGKGGQ